MSEDWQIGFKVRGLGAPEKEIVFDDHILIRGVPHSDASYVFFKFTLQNACIKFNPQTPKVNFYSDYFNMAIELGMGKGSKKKPMTKKERKERKKKRKEKR